MKKRQVSIQVEDDLDRESPLAQEYAAAFREMQRRPAPAANLLVLIFGLIGLVLLGVAAASAVSAARQAAREQSAPGRVIDLVVRVSRDSETGEITRYTHPVVEYTPAGQAARVAEAPDGATTPEYAVGDTVTVLYDPDRPAQMRVQSATSDLLLWLLPAVTFIVGAVFTAVAVGVYRFRFARREPFE